MIAALLAAMLSLPLSAEAVSRGFPVQKDEVTDFYRARAEAGQRLEWPRFATYGTLVQGQVGMLVENLGVDGALPSSSIQIVQVIDESHAIAELVCHYNETTYRVVPSGLGSEAAIPTSEPRTNRVTILLSGFDLSGIADGEAYQPVGPLVVDGTHQYTTVAGSSNTIPVVKPTEIPAYPSHPAELGVGVRTWTDSTGKFSVDAAYDGYVSGKVRLIKQTGERIDVPISRLGHDEQAFVREKIREAREAEKKEDSQGPRP